MACDDDHVLSMRDGTIWVGTVGGLARSQPGPHVSFRPYTSSHGLSDRTIFTLAEDHDGDVWVGTESSGVYEIARSGFTSFTEDDALTSNRIAAIGEDREGNLFVVSGLQFVHTFDGHQFHAWRPRFPPALFCRPVTETGGGPPATVSFDFLRSGRFPIWRTPARGPPTARES